MYKENYTNCYSYFSIESAGEILEGKGFQAADHSFFNPDDITVILGIEPFETVLMGEKRKNGNGSYPFSAWSACKQTEPAIDAREQCLNIVRQLKSSVDRLNKIRQTYKVSFTIVIVPNIYHEEAPILWFDNEIIEFCYLTRTEISVDMYIHEQEAQLAGETEDLRK